MTFNNPSALWALLLVVLALALMVLAAWLYRRAQLRFGDPALVARLSASDDGRVRWLRHGMIVGVMALLVIALAGPRMGTSTSEVRHDGLDLVVALDVSHSMLAEDVAPSRLERSRHEVMRLVDALHGDHIGLVLFAGDAFLQCPLTTDRNAIRLFLEAADPSMIPTPGTDVSRLGPVVLDVFDAASPNADRARVLLLVSDGEIHTGDVNAFSRSLREAGITTLALGVGEADGARIPTGERGEYRRDRDGNIVQTRLEETTLRTLAGESGYVHIGRTGGTAERLIPILQRLDRTEIDLTTREVPIERYQWPLALAVLMLFAERLLPTCRKMSFA